jgi:macrolide transport system ATP-binding/permease protein
MTVGAPLQVLELSRIGKQFGTEPVVHALVDVDLLLERGEWLAITGPSGAGKSTLLNIIGCLDSPTNGFYRLDGVETTTLSDKQRAGLRSQRIGFVFQSFHLLPYRTVLENVMLAEVYAAGLPVATDRAWPRSNGSASCIASTSAEQTVRRRRQRVAIARALSARQLLLCDEPTGNLDTKSSANILDCLEGLNKEGLTIVVVTHDENVASRASRRVHVVDGVVETAGQALRQADRLGAHGAGSLRAAVGITSATS